MKCKFAFKRAGFWLAIKGKVTICAFVYMVSMIVSTPVHNGRNLPSQSQANYGKWRCTCSCFLHKILCTKELRTYMLVTWGAI